MICWRFIRNILTRLMWTAARTKESTQHQEVYNNQPHPLHLQEKGSLNYNSGKTVLWDTSPPFSWYVVFLNKVDIPCLNSSSLILLACPMASSMSLDLVPLPQCGHKNYKCKSDECLMPSSFSGNDTFFLYMISGSQIWIIPPSNKQVLDSPLIILLRLNYTIIIIKKTPQVSIAKNSKG